jgi:hypothetical protein
MLKRLRRLAGGKLVPAVAGAALMAGIGSAAWATIPSSSGNLIHVCFKAADAAKANGAAVTIIDSDGGGACKDGYTDLAFNQQGVQGIQGPQGVQGVQGPKGDTGETGPIGPQGIQGPVGATGATGPTGATGSQGPKGDKGDTGATGPAGPAGPAGAGGVSGYEIVSAETTIPQLQSKEVKPACPEGKRAVGGGGWSATADVIASAPDSGFFSAGQAPGGGWYVKFYNGSALISTTGHAWAVCVSA